MAESPRDELIRRLDDYPDEVLPYFNSGFVAIARISDEIRALVLQKMITSFEGGRRKVSGTGFGSIKGIDPKDADRIASTYSLVIGLLSESGATPEDFVASARGKLFKPELETIARTLAKTICERRNEIATAIERAQLAGAVLPSFSNMNVAVDLRVQVLDGAVKMAVPVVVLHIDTDARDHEIWLQLGKADVETMAKKLTDALAEISVAETLAPPKK